MKRKSTQGQVWFSLAFCAVLMSLSVLPSIAAAADSPTLTEGENGINITADDILSEAQRLPDASRSKAFGKPQDVARLAENLYQRRSLAAEAMRDKLDQNPLAQAQLRIARDRVLSDLRLAELEKAEAPDEAAQLAYAKAAYQANPERFKGEEQVRARHILIRGLEPEARARADAVLAELKNGAGFEALATQRSEDPGSAQKGGDLGLFTRTRMVKPFADAAFALDKPGDLSSVVQSPFGFHIIQLVEKRPAGSVAFKDVEQQLKEEAVKQSIKNVRDAAAKRISESMKFNEVAIEKLAESQR